MSLPLSKYFGRAVLNPLGCSIMVGLVLVLTHVPDKSYRSEYFVDDGFGEAVFMVVLFSLLITFFSLSIFLNLNKRIANSFIMSLISWTTLPFGMILFSMADKVGFLIKYSGETETNFLIESFFFFVCISHSVFLFLTFFQFRRSLSEGEEDTSDFSQVSAG